MIIDEKRGHPAEARLPQDLGVVSRSYSTSLSVSSIYRSVSSFNPPVFTRLNVLNRLHKISIDSNVLYGLV